MQVTSANLWQPLRFIDMAELILEIGTCVVIHVWPEQPWHAQQNESTSYIQSLPFPPGLQAYPKIDAIVQAGQGPLWWISVSLMLNTPALFEKHRSR